MRDETDGVAGFHYELPETLIAREPARSRSGSRLLHVCGGQGVVGESVFSELPALLRRGDLLVVNDSRVLPARLDCVRPSTGGRVELLLVRPRDSGRWEALARPARRLHPGDVLSLHRDASVTIRLHQRSGDGLFLVSAVDNDLLGLAESHGRMPLPPYIVKARRDDGDAEETPSDLERYQTVYAQTTGSVAAPTAGLHFDDSLLDDLHSGGVGLARVCLHVGVGTFRNPDQRDMEEGRLHAETFSLDARTWRRLHETRAAGGRVIAVGTTSLRVLETVARLGLPDSDGGEDHRIWCEPETGRAEFVGTATRSNDCWSVQGATRLFLRPPESIRAADGLITNFHLPGSSLLMLLACAVGENIWRGVYAEAIARQLRFYSYGDASLIMPLADQEDAP